MSKKERFTEEHEKMATISKLNSALFTIENYNRDNSILLYFDKMQKYAVGWCYADETTIGCGFLGEIAVMYEVSEDDDRLDEGKYWCHLGKGSFINLFIPKMLEVKKPSLVEELKQQLAEKDKEIEELKKDLKSQKGVADLYLTIAGTNATKMSIEKATRHQICEEIREWCNENDFDDGKASGSQAVLLEIGTKKAVLQKLMRFLDQIEKGEE